MKAYHSDPAIKRKYMARVRAHRKADELVQGFGYWKDGRGCAVGCTIHGGDHAAYESELGIPQPIARLEDGIFEQLPACLAKMWPERFLAAIKPGQDLSLVTARFLHWLLVDPVDGVVRFAKTQEQTKAIENVANLYAKKIAGAKVSPAEWNTAAYAASAAASAASAAAYAASADYAAAAYAAYARKAARIRQSEKLLELLRNAPESKG